MCGAPLFQRCSLSFIPCLYSVFHTFNCFLCWQFTASNFSWIGPGIEWKVGRKQFVMFYNVHFTMIKPSWGRRWYTRHTTLHAIQETLTLAQYAQAGFSPFFFGYMITNSNLLRVLKSVRWGVFSVCTVTRFSKPSFVLWSGT